MRMSSLSTMYITVPVVASVDLSGSTVQFAFTQGHAQPATWYAGTWEEDEARVLVGPAGGVRTFTAGYWNLWVKVTDSPEIPVEKVATIQVY